MSIAKPVRDARLSARYGAGRVRQSTFADYPILRMSDMHRPVGSKLAARRLSDTRVLGPQCVNRLQHRQAVSTNRFVLFLRFRCAFACDSLNRFPDPEPLMPMQADARARLSALSVDAPREVYFETVRAAIAEYYLADPSNPYQQSGRSGGPERWRETRRCILQAVHRTGDFLDVGCANGLLLESLMTWATESGFSIRPHGIDFVPELIELARRRLPQHAHSFEVANAFYWAPTRQYDFVRTNLEYVQRRDWPEFIARQYTAVVNEGRLIACHYRNKDDAPVDVRALLTELGYVVVGHTEASGTSVAWCERHV